MNTIEVKFPIERHESQRGYFAASLYEHMARDERIWLVCVDLGYKVFDYHFRDFPERCINTGASEMAATGLAVGLALEGKIPVIYSITPFLLWRPAEIIRNYLNNESIPVKLIGSGRDNDYERDGFSHDATDAKGLLDLWPNITQMWPETKEDVIELTNVMLYNGQPSFLSLER